MKGRILGYSGSDFRGVIAGHDGQRYDFVRIDWGDKSRRLFRRSAVHHYKKGRYTLVVQAVDKAGNVTAKKKALRIP